MLLTLPALLFSACASFDEPGASPESAESTCDAAPSVDRSPLRRLNSRELQNALQQLFPELAVPTIDLPDGLAEDGYENDDRALQVSEALVEELEGLALDLALQTAQAAKDAGEQDPTLVAEWLEPLLEEAFRRPLSADDESRWHTLALQLLDQSDDDVPLAKGLLVLALVQSPDFLYRFEAGSPVEDEPGVQQLDDWSIASRMSFLLWQGPPDEELRAEAAAGALQDAEVREAQARRMLSDPRSEAALGDFVAQWLGLNTIPEIYKNQAAFPEFDQELWEMMKEETSRFGAAVLLAEDGSYDDLVLSSWSILTPELAALYAVQHPSGEGWETVQLPEEERAGVLTQASFLAGRGNDLHPNPIMRSVHVMDRMLCCEPPLPPTCLDTSELQQIAEGGPSTNRERYEEKVSSGACAGCHQRINPAGYAFESYDALGRYRSHDAGLPVDATGGLETAGLCVNGIPADADGDVVGGPELSALLAGSDAFGQCFVQHYLRFAVGHVLVEEDTCTSRRIYEATDTRSLEAIVVDWVRRPKFAQRQWEGQ